MKKLLAVAGLATLVLVSCNSKEGAEVQKTASGLEYQIFGKKDGKAVNDSSAVELHYMEMTEKDSIITNTHDAKQNPGGKPLSIKMDNKQMPNHIKEAIKLMHEGDSGTFLFPADSLFAGAPEEQKPAHLKKGMKTKFKLHLLKVLSDQEFEANMLAMRKERAAQMSAQRDNYIMEMKKAYGDQVKKDDDAVAKYCKDNKLTCTTTPSGLCVVIEKEGTDAVTPGAMVSVNYVGRLLSGKVFDTNLQEEAKKAGVFQEGRPYSAFEVVVGEARVIPGWDEGLTYFKKGGKGKLVIPSYLAYGKDGMQPTIPGYAPLCFDIEILDVK